MRYIIFSLLITFIFSYNPTKAIAYARKHCKNYNPLYNNYKDQSCDCSNFVSQCLIEGGLDLSKCDYRDNKGAVPNTSNLKSCLTKLGWKSQQGLPKQFKAGYPFFQGNMHARFATGVNGKTVTFCDHKCTDTCDGTISDDKLIYYYL